MQPQYPEEPLPNAVPGWRKPATALLILISLVFYGLAFVHLKADFPNNSPWNDWSKTTDEGWYAGGAVHQAIFGRWIVPGAFNPVVAMPVWSVLAHLWFRVAGFGIVQLRVEALLLFGICLLLFFRLVGRAAGTLYAALAVTLLTTNPYIYSFTRLALLEQVMLFFLLVAWFLTAETIARNDAASYTGAVLVGLCIAATVLSKSSGAALAPAILLFQWLSAPAQDCRKTRISRATVSLAAAAAVYAAYFVLAIRPHAADYRLVFAINNYRVHLSIIPRVAWLTVRAGAWTNPTLYLLALLALAAATFRVRSLWQQPFFASTACAAACYMVFICYHTNIQPRYYLLTAPCIVAVVVLSLHTLACQPGKTSNAASLAGTAIVAFTALAMAWQTARYVLHPQYTYLTAVNGIAGIIHANPERQLIIANQGDNLSLYQGLASICDAYTAETPSQLIGRYHPGWYAVILSSRPSPMLLALQSRYRLQEAAHYHVFDDPVTNTFTLYRLIPLQPPQERLHTSHQQSLL